MAMTDKNFQHTLNNINYSKNEVKSFWKKLMEGMNRFFTALGMNMKEHSTLAVAMEDILNLMQGDVKIDSRVDVNSTESSSDLPNQNVTDTNRNKPKITEETAIEELQNKRIVGKKSFMGDYYILKPKTYSTTLGYRTTEEKRFTTAESVSKIMDYNERFKSAYGVEGNLYVITKTNEGNKVTIDGGVMEQINENRGELQSSKDRFNSLTEKDVEDRMKFCRK
jgi:hypothetical protein